MVNLRYTSFAGHDLKLALWDWKFPQNDPYLVSLKIHGNSILSMVAKRRETILRAARFLEENPSTDGVFMSLKDQGGNSLERRRGVVSRAIDNWGVRHLPPSLKSSAPKPDFLEDFSIIVSRVFIPEYNPEPLVVWILVQDSDEKAIGQIIMNLGEDFSCEDPEAHISRLRETIESLKDS
jgi:hypothetical protein